MSGPYYFYLHIFTKEDKITLFLLATKSITVNFSDAGTGGPVALAPQYMPDQLTLFEPGRADYPHLLCTTDTLNVLYHQVHNTALSTNT